MNTAQDLVRNTFQSDFDRRQFGDFINRLLKNADFSKQFSQSGGNVRQAFRDKVSSFERIAQFTDVDGNKVDVLIVNLRRDSTIERGRTSLRNFAADYLQSDRGLGKAAVLVAYVSESKRDWRFSYVTLEKSLVKQESGRFKETVTTLTPARRFSFLVGREEKTHTAQRQFFNLLQSQSAPTLRQIEEAFSIEKVTDEFYKDYEKLFRRLEKEIESLRDGDSKLDEHLKENFIENADFSKKLLGQIVFLYFLQKKGWFGVERGAEWGSGNKIFLRYLFEHRAKLGTRQERRARKDVSFFNDILEHLFYDALARERDEDYYARFDCKIPFLNGGLFEAAYSWTSVDVLLPDDLFSNTEPIKDGDKGTGILDVFDRYNFTVNEAEPLEKDVAVDPEMLGKVFENLLPENERKGKGSFYTPRQIVNYMCQQSLISYLATHLPDVPRADIETFIHIGDFQSAYEAAGTKKYEENFLPESVSKNAGRIDALLEGIAVCDPAIGSGAFPVGMMQEIVRARSSLTDTLDTARPNKSRSEREKFERSRTAYELKRHLIQCSLYGVDIDPGAVEIAKLRLWLSLVVDEDERERVQALPNLDYKIMQGNALLDEFAGVKLIEDAVFEKPVMHIEAERAAIQQRIRELEKQLYALHGKGAEARELKRKFSKETDRLVKQSKELTQPKAAEKVSLLPDDPYREARATLDEIRRQIDEFFSLTSPTEKREARARIERLEWRFMEQTLTARGERDALKELALHRRDNRKPYFLWKLYFSDVFQGKGGFDVVIGNPPYLNVERVDADTKQAYIRKYQTFYKRYDVFGLFFELALTQLVSKGNVAFIIPSQILNNLSYKKLRDLMLSNEWLNEVFYLGDKIFQEASNDVCVLFLQKPKTDSIRLVNALDFEERTITEVETDYFDKFERVISFSADAGSELIFDRIFNPEFPKLREGFDVFQGIVTGNNPVFLLTDEQIREARIEKKLLHPVLLGRDFEKWRIRNADRQIIYLDSNTDIKKFPNAEKWLMPYKRELMQRRECQRGVIPWYSLQWARNKEQLDYTPKIMVQGTRNPRLKTRVVAALDEEGFYGVQSINFIVPKNSSAPVKFLLAILNSSLINYLYQTKFLNVAIKGEYLKDTPIPPAKSEQQTLIARLVDYILFLKANPQDESHGGLITEYFEQVINALVYELYLPEELHAADKRFFAPLAAELLPSLTDHEGDELRVIRKLFERLSDVNHPVRKNLYFLDNLESVRIIEGK